MIFHGSLWHGGGANTTADDRRLGVNVQYCPGFVRQQQNPYLGIPPEIAATFSDRLLELLGYRLYKGIMGHVDGASPGEVVFGDRMAETGLPARRTSPAGSSGSARRSLRAAPAVGGLVESPSMFGPTRGGATERRSCTSRVTVSSTSGSRGVIRDLRAGLRQDPRVTLRKSTSGWVEVRIASSDDVAFVLDLVDRAAAAHRAGPGETPKAPPVGPELERRRRFH